MLRHLWRVALRWGAVLIGDSQSLEFDELLLRSETKGTKLSFTLKYAY